MAKIAKTGCTPQQRAYAIRTFGGKGTSKKQIALDVGYSPWVANTPRSKIETTKGYNNAMAKLAAESNNISLMVMSELKGRGFEDFSNKDLVGALNAIAGAWKAFNTPFREKSLDGEKDDGKNLLRTVILQRVENQNLTAPMPVSAIASQEDIKKAEEVVYERQEEVNDNMDF